MAVTRAVFVALACLFVAVPDAHAEAVFLRSEARDAGGGWLFGSPSTGDCWLVFAAHVLAERVESTQLLDGTLRTQAGKEYAVRSPLRPSTLPIDYDVGFAPVRGRSRERCLSRLGDLDIGRSLDAGRELLIAKTFANSARRLRFRVSDFGGEFVYLRPDDPGAREAASSRRGLSGSPVLLVGDDGGVRPIALVLNYLPSDGVFEALRFDVIRPAFLAHEKRLSTESARSDAAATPTALPAPELLSIDGETRATDRAENSSVTTNCRSIFSNGERLRIDLLYAIDAPRTSRPTLELRFDTSCGGVPDAVVAARHEGTGWYQLPDCTLSEEHARCPQPAGGAARVRLGLVVRDGRGIGVGSATLVD